LDFFLERTNLFMCPSICATKPCARKPISQALSRKGTAPSK
jgi:hypothetical protein